jgi:hypothetical protein
MSISRPHVEHFMVGKKLSGLMPSAILNAIPVHPGSTKLVRWEVAHT